MVLDKYLFGFLANQEHRYIIGHIDVDLQQYTVHDYIRDVEFLLRKVVPVLQ